jgi:heme-degrading monooxygenase HmoA
MLVIIWEYQVKAERAAEFEEMYATSGKWAELFKGAAGYQGTELLRDPNNARRYLTIDRWDSPEHYERFLSQWKSAYEALEAQSEGLTEKEFLAGKWESISPETR